MVPYQMPIILGKVPADTKGDILCTFVGWVAVYYHMCVLYCKAYGMYRQVEVSTYR